MYVISITNATKYLNTSFQRTCDHIRKNGLIAGLAKIDFFPGKAFTKFKYCLRKI